MKTLTLAAALIVTGFIIPQAHAQIASAQLSYNSHVSVYATRSGNTITAHAYLAPDCQIGQNCFGISLLGVGENGQQFSSVAAARQGVLNAVTASPYNCGQVDIDGDGIGDLAVGSIRIHDDAATEVRLFSHPVTLGCN
jgi:hypothetical protein